MGTDAIQKAGSRPTFIQAGMLIREPSHDRTEWLVQELRKVGDDPVMAVLRRSQDVRVLLAMALRVNGWTLAADFDPDIEPNDEDDDEDDEVADG